MRETVAARGPVPFGDPRRRIGPKVAPARISLPVNAPTQPPAPAPARPALVALASALARHPAFGLLDDPARQALSARFSLATCPAGQTVAEGAALRQALGLVVAGSVTMQKGNDGPALFLSPGDCFGAGAGPHDRAADWSARASSDLQVAWLPATELSGLLAEHPVLSFHLVAPAAESATGSDPQLGLMTRAVRSLLRRPPITLSPQATILQTAQAMREHRVSSVLLIEGDALVGIVTDRDLRNRALAAGLSPERPVLEIATAEPLTVQAQQPAFEALLLMARRNVHHVPVLEGRSLAGMITATDLTEQHSTSAVYLVGEIHKQASVEGLAACADKTKSLQRGLAAADASAYSTGHIVTAVTDAITVRLLQLAETALGPPPVPYAWVAAGSQARNEQTARSDQDNCLILDDAYDATAHGAYFLELARRVNDGLNACGYVYCPGEMMARTDTWRQPLARWIDNFRRWTDEPEPMALMLTCVFFDLRLIHGHAPLLEALHAEMLTCTRDNRLFLAHMVGNALKHRAPLSLFGGISTVRHGALRDAVDLKHNGIVPIVDLARVYALAGGYEVANTHDRLLVAARSREISERSARDLRDALEFLAVTRIRHQAAQIARGEPPDNFLSLSELGNFERGQLRDAFGVVQTLQSVLAQRYR